MLIASYYFEESIRYKISHYKNTTDHYFGHNKWLSEQDIKQNTVTKDEHMHMFHNVAIIWT